ncbi:MAG: DUF2970 domain-containing protein [Chromatiales bacterium]|nr:DUF2970 domain-containing protein [Chromatiales bacterium]
MRYWDIVKSVLASFLGVQSDKNRKRDFQQGKASHFIVVGIVMTILFIVLLWGIVQFVLYMSGL